MNFPDAQPKDSLITPEEFYSLLADPQKCCANPVRQNGMAFGFHCGHMGFHPQARCGSCLAVWVGP